MSTFGFMTTFRFTVRNFLFATTSRQALESIQLRSHSTEGQFPGM